MNYGAGRLLNCDTVRYLIGERLNRISKQFCQRGLLAIIVVRVVSVAPFILINLVAGAIRIRFSHFVIGTAIAMMPGTLAITVFGDQLRNLLQGKGEFNIWLVIAVVAVVVIGLFGLRWWFVKTKQVAIADKDRSR